MPKFSKADFLKGIKKGVGVVKGAKKAASNFRAARKSNKQSLKNIDKLARAKVKKNVRGGESAEMLQQDFMKTRKKLRKKHGY